MVKKFIIFSVTLFILIIVLNFAFASASISGADKIRILSSAITVSIVEIAVIFAALFSFFKSANRLSQKESLRSFALNAVDDGVVLYNSSHLVLFMNSKAEEFLGVKYAEVADMPLNPEFSLRNPQFSKLIGTIFYSKPEPEHDRFFVKESEISVGKEKIFAKILKPKGLMQFQR
ncbi:MAG: hypothetical protein AAB556_02145 [Patescibacteria group bacterium]|mgnify:CR=1 FL=1